MVATTNSEYLYQKPEDCFPEADLIKNISKDLTRGIQFSFRGLMRSLLSLQPEKSTSNTYDVAEMVLYFDLMKNAPEALRKIYLNAGQLGPDTTDLRPLLK